MEKTHKHSSEYIGSFSKNPHVAQCYTCWMNNYRLSRESRGCTSENKTELIVGIDDQFSQEWYKKSAMLNEPAKTEYFWDGEKETQKYSEELFFCINCQKEWEYAESPYDSYEEWSEACASQPQPFKTVVHC